MEKHISFFKEGKKKKKPKGKTAKFSTAIKTEICKRDRGCIFCGQPGTDCHHVYFGTETNYGENRNETDQGVLVCRKAHQEIHGCPQGEGKRQEAINYLQKYYN